MSKSTWGNIGAWAAEAEREEEEQKELAAKAAAAGGGGRDPQSFPPLKESVSSSKQTKKKTRTTLSLQEFNMQSSYGSGSGSASAQRGLTPEEMLRLPTGPKERAPGDDSGGRLGGGFSSYGSGRGPGGSGDGQRRSYGGFDDDRRRSSPRVSDSDHISRADEVDNWAAMKKPMPSQFGGPGSGPARPSRYTSLGGGGDSGGGGFSRADDVDNWSSMKKTTPFPPPSASRSPSFGSGFRPEPDRWTRDRDATQENKQSLVLDSEEIVKVNRPNPFGAARPREEVLAEKGLDWKKLESDIETKKILSRPNSSQSSRPGSSQSVHSELQGAEEGNANAAAAVKAAKPKVNPFGDAKPREVLLQEKGLDWRKIDLDLEHRRVERPDSEEEKALKEEIEHLKKESELPGDSQSSILEQINQKEKDLDLLIRELDDKVRFGQRPPSSSERQRGGEFMDRPRSRGGGDFMDRPRSRGGGDFMDRPRSRGGSGEDRRAIHVGRGRGGYPGTREMDRPSSRGERW